MPWRPNCSERSTSPPGEHLSVPPALAKDKRYDQILHLERTEGRFTNNAGVLDFYDGGVAPHTSELPVPRYALARRIFAVHCPMRRARNPSPAWHHIQPYPGPSRRLGMWRRPYFHFPQNGAELDMPSSQTAWYAAGSRASRAPTRLRRPSSSGWALNSRSVWAGPGGSASPPKRTPSVV